MSETPNDTHLENYFRRHVNDRDQLSTVEDLLPSSAIEESETNLPVLTTNSTFLRNRTIYLEDFIDNEEDHTIAIQTALSLGIPIQGIANKIYTVSSRIKPAVGSSLSCEGGRFTISFKTGSGGFNILDVGGVTPRTSADRCGFWFDNLNGFKLENIDFTVDGVKEVVIWPIIVTQGSQSRRFEFNNLCFYGFSVATMIKLDSIGLAGYYIDRPIFRDCGTALGSSYWTGTIGVAGIDFDGDMIGGQQSYFGYIISPKVERLLLTGTALADFGQQTDGITIGGIVNSDRKGPVISDMYIDGAGEGVDCFSSHASIHIARARNCQYYVAKVIHGAQYNNIRIDSVESSGLATFGCFGSETATHHTKQNYCKVGTVKGAGTVYPPGTGGYVIFVADSGGDASHCLPKDNVIEVGNVEGDSINMLEVVHCSEVNNANNNIIRVSKAKGWVNKFCSGTPENDMIRYGQSTDVLLGLSGNQTITSGVETVLEFNTTLKDKNAEAVNGSNKIRCQFPGNKLISCQIRVSNLNVGDPVTIGIYRNASAVVIPTLFSASASSQTFYVPALIDISEEHVNDADADIFIKVTITTAAGPIIVTANSTVTFLRVTDMNAA